ncbi:MAG: hypothetical protein QOC81_158 [Thermoanaerobaculia bacterium]|jgi:hypothetical protein|nr:hypothetical protein [Thermoanaerobaculia bacterium]
MTRRGLLVVFVVLLAGTSAMMVVLQRHGAPLEARGGYKIGCLELTPSSETAAKIVKAWSDKKLLEVALEDIRFDYAFIALYTATLALTCFFGASLFSGFFGRAGTILGWLMFIAGPMDVFENLGMAAEICGNYAIAPVVFTVSSIKWLISIAAFLYALPTLVVMLIRLPSLLRQDRMHSYTDSR